MTNRYQVRTPFLVVVAGVTLLGCGQTYPAVDEINEGDLRRDVSTLAHDRSSAGVGFSSLYRIRDECGRSPEGAYSLRHRANVNPTG